MTSTVTVPPPAGTSSRCQCHPHHCDWTSVRRTGRRRNADASHTDRPAAGTSSHCRCRRCRPLTVWRRSAALILLAAGESLPVDESMSHTPGVLARRGESLPVVETMLRVCWHVETTRLLARRVDAAALRLLARRGESPAGWRSQAEGVGVECLLLAGWCAVSRSSRHVPTGSCRSRRRSRPNGDGSRRRQAGGARPRVSASSASCLLNGVQPAGGVDTFRRAAVVAAEEGARMATGVGAAGRRVDAARSEFAGTGIDSTAGAASRCRSTPTAGTSRQVAAGRRVDAAVASSLAAVDWAGVVVQAEGAVVGVDSASLPEGAVVREADGAAVADA